MTGCGGTGTGEDSDAAETPAFSVTVNKTGTGSGQVVSSPSGIECGSVCETTYPEGTTVTLMPTPDAGSMFSGWTGDADCADGRLFVDAVRSCTAKFDLIELVSILVTPDNPTIGLGKKQQFKGKYSASSVSVQFLKYF